MTATLIESYPEKISIIKSLKPKEIIKLTKKSKRQEMNCATHWVKSGHYVLTQKDRTIITNGDWLTDIHVGMAQMLLKLKYTSINGLQTEDTNIS